MPTCFADFLEAKFPLDERSLNRDVRDAFVHALHGLPRVDCLDVGAGTCATVRRLLRCGIATPLFVTALDRDSRLLDDGRQTLRGWLSAQGLESSVDGNRLQTRDGNTVICFAACELKDYRPQRRYDAIIAHAFLDIVPLPQALERLAEWLRPGGYLYASINYDGETALRPVYGDARFESSLLAQYNQSMESRRVDGQATGGAYCGRRLQSLLPEYGFDIVAQGRSDWVIRGSGDGYPDGDALCLLTLLEWILDEGRNCDRFDSHALTQWHQDRLRLLQQGRLELGIRHVDVLARYDPRSARA